MFVRMRNVQCQFHIERLIDLLSFALLLWNQSWPRVDPWGTPVCSQPIKQLYTHGAFTSVLTHTHLHINFPSFISPVLKLPRSGFLLVCFQHNCFTKLSCL